MEKGSGAVFKGVKRALIASVLLFAFLFAAAPAQAATDLGPTGSYIVRINPDGRDAVALAIQDAGGAIDDSFEYAFDGYLVKISRALSPLLWNIPHVVSVEEDGLVTTDAVQGYETPTPSWGIDRIDQTNIIGFASDGYVSSYGYKSAGEGSTIYIGDTGIYPHSDLGSRLSKSGYSGFADGNGTVDCNGHGTHVATTAAGTVYGVAKNARVVPVRILNCAGSGSYSGVIAGLDWILSPLNPNPKTQAVLNLSIGGSVSASVNAAILRLTNAGITVVVAAGNSNLNSCNYSPSSAPSAITVGSTTLSDAKASYSNYGSCVDIQAPGSLITAGWFGSPTITNTISGTSMASPHVAGAVAVLRGLYPDASVAQVTDILTSTATPGVITGLTGLAAGTVNKLLYLSPTDGGDAVISPAVQVS
ncbi:MAG: S8 family serine peptidase, partial [Actinobacteria bacterium]|nr:S8 family serine peptidase [Actinomycetota bacterium]